jgi:hypothetical protein
MISKCLETIARVLSPKGQGRLKYSLETPTVYQNNLAMRNSDVTGGKTIAI